MHRCGKKAARCQREREKERESARARASERERKSDREIVYERVTYTPSHVCMSANTLTHTLAYLCTVPIAAETDGLARFRAVCRAT